MKSYEVIRAAVEERGVKAVAAAMKVSAALVYKWCEPTPDDDAGEQSGAKNPLDRARELYELTKDIRLVRYLCNEAGGFYVSNPAPDPDRTHDEKIYNESRKIVREFSELLDAVTASVEDDSSVDRDEADEIRQKWEDLKMQVEGFVRACEQGHYHVTGVRNQGTGLRNQGSGVRNQGSGVRNQGSGVRNQGSGVRNQGSGVRNQGSGVRNQGSGGRNQASEGKSD